MRAHVAQRLEVESRREGVEFRNQASDGPHLRIYNALWQLPSRAAVAKPKFVDGVPTFAANEDEYPAAEAMLNVTPQVDVQTCQTCGHQTTRFDALEQSEWLTAALTAAAEALRGKYDLSDEQLSDLLVLDGESATWLVQIDQWAKGGETTIPDPPAFDFSHIFDVPAETELFDPPPPPKRTLRERLGQWLLKRYQ